MEDDEEIELENEEDIWLELEKAFLRLGKLKKEDIKGTTLEAPALSTLFKDGDLTPDDMAAELVEAILEILDSKKK